MSALEQTSRLARAASDRYRSSPRLRIAAIAAAFAAVTVLTYLIANPRMLTGFGFYDDEGYMLVALNSFLDQGSLYDDVFTQYGPFYYEFWGAVFSVFGIPVTHDGGRAVTTIVWVVTSLALGLSAMRMTGSALLGLATQMLVFSSLGTLTAEPMHPGGIIVLLLAAIVAISCAVRERVSVGAMALLGAAIAALILVKVNVGAFALAAVALACVASYRVLSERRWLRLLVEIGFVAIPFVLMAGKFGEEWVRHYAIHVSIAALAVVIVLRAREGGERASEELGWLVGGFVVLAITVCAAIVAAGTSPGGLFEGVIGQPLRQADAFSIPMGLSNRIYWYDLGALAGALAYFYVVRRGGAPRDAGWVTMVSLLSILIGIEMSLSVIGKSFPFDAQEFAGYQQSLLSFAWVALIPVAGASHRNVGFARLLLPPLAVLQALHAYPVAGNQTLWAAFLLIPVGAICVGNGVQGLVGSLRGVGERRGAAAIGVATAVFLLAFVANITLRESLQSARAAYDSSIPLDLPGAGNVRIGQPEVEQYRQVTAAIDANCAAVAMLPGMNSFYVWADQEPPTGYNATGWPTLFDEPHERRVIEDIDPVAGLCLLENEPLAAWWGGETIPDEPLVRYMRREFRPILTIGDYRLLGRPARGSTS
jgi:hypothetical protein